VARRPVGIGVDGCNGGWAVALLGAGAVPELHVIERIEQLPTLLPRLPASATALVDIPIGLPVHGAREVDALARRLLGPAGASVFPVPPRPAFDGLDYEEASTLCRAAGAGGLTVQAWNIMGKIREVDLWLRRRGTVGLRLRESHPELAFKGLAHRADLPWPLPAKRTAAGRAARLAVLAAHGLEGQAVLAQRPANPAGAVAADDKLDAACLALLSRQLAAGEALATLPERPSKDALGLPQEMVLPVEALVDDRALDAEPRC
jgi:predicted RNase H-like nuclease